MIYLKLVNFSEVANWGYDYQKKSKNYEPIPDKAEIWGIFKGEELMGYFATMAYRSGVVEINQGYLKQDARHRQYARVSMQLLEDKVKKAGFKEIVLATNRAVSSYQRFMNQCGFQLTRAIFSKKV